MSAPFIVLSDQDHPLAAWEEGLHRDARQRFPDISLGSPGDRAQFDTDDDRTPEQQHVVATVKRAPGFYGRLEEVPGGADTLNRYEQDGAATFIVTTPSLSNPTCPSEKLAWVERVHGRDRALHTILTHDKTVIRGDVMIDDHPGMTGSMDPVWQQIVFDASWNRTVNLPRISAWDDVPTLGDLQRKMRPLPADAADSPFTVLIDLDETAYGWGEQVVPLARKLRPGVTVNEHTSWTSWDILSGPPAEAEAIAAAMAHPDLYGMLRPNPGAVDVVNQLLDDGVNVFFVSTADLNNPECANQKYRSVARDFGDRMARRTVLTHDKTMVRGHLLIDDKTTIKGLLSPTWKQVVFDTSYNKSTPGRRVRHWSEVPSIVADAQRVWEINRKLAA